MTPSSSPHSGRSPPPANHHISGWRPLNFPGIRPSFDQSSFVHFSFQFSPNNNFLPIGNLRRCSEGGEAKARLHFCLLIVQVLETSGTATRRRPAEGSFQNTFASFAASLRRNQYCFYGTMANPSHEAPQVGLIRLLPRQSS